MVLVAPNAASLLDRVQACTTPTIKKWVDTARTETFSADGTDDAAHGASTHY